MGNANERVLPLREARKPVETARSDRRQQMYNEGNMLEVFSLDFDRKITPTHLKDMKAIVEEKRRLWSEATALINQAEDVAKYLVLTLSGVIVSLYYVTVTNDLKALAHCPWWLKIMITFFFFTMANKYLYEYSLKKLHYMWDNDQPEGIFGSRHQVLVIRTNQLRSLIDCSTAEVIDDIPQLEEESAGDTFHAWCEEVVIPIRDAHLHLIRYHIGMIYRFAICVFVFLGISKHLH